jgi:hypothetical protein
MFLDNNSEQLPFSRKLASFDGILYPYSSFFVQASMEFSISAGSNEIPYSVMTSSFSPSTSSVPVLPSDGRQSSIIDSQNRQNHSNAHPLHSSYVSKSHTSVQHSRILSQTKLGITPRSENIFRLFRHHHR